MGTRSGTRAGTWLLERVLGRYVPRFVSLPLLLVLALFRALRFERGLAWSTVNLSGLFTIALEADGTVREVSKIDGYIK